MCKRESVCSFSIYVTSHMSECKSMGVLWRCVSCVHLYLSPVFEHEARCILFHVLAMSTCVLVSL